MSGALELVGLAATSPATPVLLLLGLVLRQASRGAVDSIALGLLVVLAGVGIGLRPAESLLPVSIASVVLGWAAGRGLARAERGGLEGLLVLGCVVVFVLSRPEPVQGEGPTAWLELWLRAPATPLLAGVGVCLGLGRVTPGVVFGAAALVMGLALEGRPRIVEGGALLAVVLGAAGAEATGRLRVAVLGAAPALLAFALLAGPLLVNPYGHPPELPRTRAAVLDVRVRGGALISGLAVAPDGRVFYGEMPTGAVRELLPGQIGEGGLLTRIQLPEIQGSRASYELGLWGLTVDPTGTWLYAMAAHRWDEGAEDPQARSSRIVRVPLDGPHRGQVADVFVGVPAGPIHSGGVLAFGPDGLLYVTVGDGLLYGPRGDEGGEPGPGPDQLAGAILRLTPEGAPAPGNPVAGSPVFAWGFRNPYGIAFGADGELLVTENGGPCCDRLFSVSAGAHHGWPQRESETVEPLWDSGVHRLGVTGLVVLGDRFGADAGNLVFATWHTGALHQVRRNADGAITDHRILLDVPPARPDPSAPYAFAGAFTALATGPDGVVWFSTLNAVGRIESLR